jgi:hypothetical protein
MYQPLSPDYWLLPFLPQSLCALFKVADMGYDSCINPRLLGWVGYLKGFKPRVWFKCKLLYLISLTQ